MSTWPMPVGIAAIVALRRRRPWLVPTVFWIVLVPAFLVLLFVLVS